MGQPAKRGCIWYTIGNMPEQDSAEPTLHDVMNVLHTMNGRFDTIDEQLAVVTQDVSTLKTNVEDIKETVESIEQAVDKDAVTLVNLEERIEKFETV